MPTSFRRTFSLFASASVALLLVISMVLTHVHAEPRTPTATYSGGRLQLTVPFHATVAGAGKLQLELLDPEDHVLGRTERAITLHAGDGAWRESLSPGTPVPYDEIVWQRVHYRFTYDNAQAQPIDGIASVSNILLRPVVRILGQSEYLAGSDAAIRVIVAAAGTAGAADAPVTGTVRVSLVDAAAKSHALFTGRLNARGTLEAQFRFPAGVTGACQLRFTADTPIGTTEYTQPIQVADRASILLTTEKPIYQPGQAIHIRALALDRSSHHAEAARPLTFELEDSRGNKVFKHATTTDAFGIASTEFSLADEVNLGTYHLRALMGDAAQPSTTAELALTVDRYVLPKFKVAVDFDAVNGKVKRDFRPGDHVTGTVYANYFFGKPVDHAEITVKLSSADVQVVEAAKTRGSTDGEGTFRFDLRLPGYFAGKDLSQGAARALVEASVKDAAAHTETRGEPVTISRDPLLMTAVPEGGTLIPHLDNRIYLLASYPDGTPAANTSVTANFHGLHLIGQQDAQATTDAGGVAVIHYRPGNDMPAMEVHADDHRGARVTTTVALDSRSGNDQVLLRTDRAIVKAGDRVLLRVFSTRLHGTAYVDVVHSGQTILTRDVELNNGEASVTLTATPEMAGTLDLNAYIFGSDAQPVADHRLLFVQPADELHIATMTDAASYKPGAEARVRFHVTNTRGEGVSAALGLQVVDEAVFALAEKQPGFAKVFFLLEQEVMKPRYEIHSLSMASIVESVTGDGQQERAAQALFSATEMAAPHRLDAEFGRDVPQERYAAYAARYRQVFKDRVDQMLESVNANAGRGDVSDRVRSAAADVADSWGTRLRVEPHSWGRGNSFFEVRSAGPDGRFDTADDLTLHLQVRYGNVDRSGPSQGRLRTEIVHGVGAFNGRGAVSGEVLDASGAAIRGASVRLRVAGAQESRTAVSEDDGKFQLAGLMPGTYRVEITSPGFAMLSGSVTLLARDHAELHATLQVGQMAQTVAVAAGMPLMARKTLHGNVFAVPAPMAFVAGAARMNVDEVDNLPVEQRSFALLKAKAEPAAPHVRSWFPEALYINPEILTDGHGNAEVSIPIADSITTWRMAMLASTQSGALGTGTSSLKVFQDFFADLDLPVTLTQGDRVTLPVAVYNYAGHSGKVQLKLQPEAWYSLADEPGTKSVTVESGRVGSASFTLSANRIGKFKLTLSANMEGRADIVVREIEVVPNGQEQSTVFNGRLEHATEQTVVFPANALPEASTLFVRLYPGPLSQIVEGMDGILRMPGGCFEQTSSSTYPNILALDYMKRTKKLTPEIHAKAEGYIANGYQRLLTFEVPGGGFSWFGEAPANKILTAYGLMEFNDMSKVAEVDPRLIVRTRDWLAAQQQPDGSWKPDTSFINEGATNRFNTDTLRITAYVAWSLANTGAQGSVVEKAKHYIEAHANANVDAYTLAVIANFAVDYNKDREFTSQAMQSLLDKATKKDDSVFWTAEETGYYATGRSAAVETTGLATQALLKWGQASETARKALNFITANKLSAGNWGTTQATITSLRALVLATQHGTADVRGTVKVEVNGKTVETLALTAANNDLYHQLVVRSADLQATDVVRLTFEGTGSLAYQVAGRYFTPWQRTPKREALAIDVAYDRTTLTENDIATATATVHNNLDKTANMIMVDLGIPPGFDLLSEDLQTMQEQTAHDRTGKLQKFSMTATQAILYFNALAPQQTVKIRFRLRAKYPIRAKTFESKVYEYYDPEVKASATPIQLEVTRK